MIPGKKNDSTFIRGMTFRLYPTREQTHVLNRHAGITRSFHNILLEEAKTDFAKWEKVGTFFDFAHRAKELKKVPGKEYLSIAPSQSLICAARDLSDTFGRHFEWLHLLKTNPSETGRKQGFPKFRRRGRHESFRIPQGGYVCDTKPNPGYKIDLDRDRILVPKLGWVRCRFLRDPRMYKGWIGGRPKAATFRRDHGKWSVSILMEFEGRMPGRIERIGTCAGIDRGVVRPFQLSYGTWLDIPDISGIDGKIGNLQRHRSRKCVKGFRRWRDIGKEIGKLHLLKRNVIEDFLQKSTTRLSRALDLVAVEKLDIRGMTKSAKGTAENPGKNVRQKSGLNRSILDRRWGRFLHLLRYKMEELGHVLVEVNPACTSQTCPVCGHVDRENRKGQEKFVCRSCGHEDNADRNAAVNILLLGLERIAGEGIDFSGLKGKISGQAEWASGLGVLPNLRGNRGEDGETFRNGSLQTVPIEAGGNPSGKCCTVLA